MLKHDPFAPMARAEMADRWERAAHARLRRSRREEGALASPGTASPLRRLTSLIRGSAPEMRTSLDSPAEGNDPRAPRVAPPYGG